jgi:hypothetical protein
VKISRAHSERDFFLEDNMVEFLLLRTRGKGESQDGFYLRAAAVERRRFVNPRAASTAALRNAGRQLIAVASMTCPASEMTIRISTFP